MNEYFFIRVRLDIFSHFFLSPPPPPAVMMPINHKFHKRLIQQKKTGSLYPVVYDPI